MKTREYDYFYLGCSAKQRGFTLLELMVTISLAVILTAVAAPSLLNLPANARLSKLSEGISDQIQNARSEAIRTDRIVYVCAIMKNSLLQADNCIANNKTNNDWSSGAMVYSDTNALGKKAFYDTGEKISSAVFDRKVAVSAEVAPFSSHSSKLVAQLAFSPTGRQQNLTEIDFKLFDNASNLCRGLIVDPSGRTHTCKKGEVDCADICA